MSKRVDGKDILGYFVPGRLVGISMDGSPAAPMIVKELEANTGTEIILQGVLNPSSFILNPKLEWVMWVTLPTEYYDLANEDRESLDSSEASGTAGDVTP